MTTRDKFTARVQRHQCDAVDLWVAMKKEGPAIIRELLKVTGWSLRELCRRSNCSPTYLSVCKNRKQVMSFDTYLYLAMLLKRVKGGWEKP